MGGSTRVIDVGVFIGSFSNAVHLVSDALSLPVKINAFEANPMLISPLIHNFGLYKSKVHLHLNGIGKSRCVMELCVSPGGAIGASFVNTSSRKYGDYYSCDVDVLPLREILRDESELELVKLDIEGF